MAPTHGDDRTQLGLSLTENFPVPVEGPRTSSAQFPSKPPETRAIVPPSSPLQPAVEDSNEELLTRLIPFSDERTVTTVPDVTMSGGRSGSVFEANRRNE